MSWKTQEGLGMSEVSPTFLLGQPEYPGGHFMVRKCVCGWDENGQESGQDFQLMEQCMKQRQHKVTAAAFSPVLLPL